ncbi:hypothetical protein [Silvimonas sp.]|uniref:hypothetical protein n=1 Tax=Silvimonas sp. TaxID=2650811 RepID=UPI00283F2225|nr:hypothetical protein [Silvimonas sp.]MDR3429698.1 hypothetical protein [Silvimonas sp.]
MQTLITLLVWIVLATLNAVAIYALITKEMYAQPRRFFFIALAPLSITFLMQTCVEVMANALDKLDPHTVHLYDIKLGFSFFNNIALILSGALVSVAVTNRALFLNREAIKEARRDIKAHRQCHKSAIQALKKYISNPDSRLSSEELAKKQEELKQRITNYQRRRRLLKGRLKALKP